MSTNVHILPINCWGLKLNILFIPSFFVSLRITFLTFCLQFLSCLFTTTVIISLDGFLFSWCLQIDSIFFLFFFNIFFYSLVLNILLPFIHPQTTHHIFFRPIPYVLLCVLLSSLSTTLFIPSVNSHFQKTLRKKYKMFFMVYKTFRVGNIKMKWIK